MLDEFKKPCGHEPSGMVSAWDDRDICEDEWDGGCCRGTILDEAAVQARLDELEAEMDKCAPELRAENAKLRAALEYAYARFSDINAIARYAQERDQKLRMERGLKNVVAMTLLACSNARQALEGDYQHAG